MTTPEFFNSDLLALFIFTIPLFVSFVVKRSYFLKLFLPAQASVLFLGQFLKRLFEAQRPISERPEVLGAISNIPTDFSFPSIHTAAATLLAWIMSFIYPKMASVWFGILFIIAVSRIGLGLHYPRDVLAGFGLATFVFWFFYFLSNVKSVLVWASNPSIRRKIVHLIYGFFLVFLIEYEFINTAIYLLFLITALFIYLCSQKLPKNIKNIIIYFERDRTDQKLFKGPLLFTLSTFISYILFPKEIAIVAILNLAIGDSVNALIGSFLKVAKKRIDASVASFLATLVVASQFVGIFQAFAGSFITMIFEYSEPKIKGKKIDDNIFIPLVSGGIIYLLSLF
jgi:dolichol kinase